MLLHVGEADMQRHSKSIDLIGFGSTPSTPPCNDTLLAPCELDLECHCMSASPAMHGGEAVMQQHVNCQGNTPSL